MKRITEKNAKFNLRFKKIRIIMVFFVFAMFALLALVRFLPTIKTIDVNIKVVSKSKDNDIKITKEEIQQSSNLKIGDKLYKFLRSEIADNIEKNPYIKSVEVLRNISGNVKLNVIQRSPKYMINFSGEYLYVDNEGYILEINSENNGSPIIIGFATDFSSLSIGTSKIRLESKDLEKLKIVNNILEALESNDVKNVITSVDVTDKNDIILNLEDDRKSVHLGDGTELNTKVLYMKKILEKEVENTGIIFINGNLDEGYVYFKEQ